jgi:hypothetical protein
MVSRVDQDSRAAVALALLSCIVARERVYSVNNFGIDPDLVSLMYLAVQLLDISARRLGHLEAMA